MDDTTYTNDPDCDCADCLFDRYADADPHLMAPAHPLPTYAATDACGCNACQEAIDRYWGDIYCNG